MDIDNKIGLNLMQVSSVKNKILASPDDPINSKILKYGTVITTAFAVLNILVGLFQSNLLAAKISTTLGWGLVALQAFDSKRWFNMAMKMSAELQACYIVASGKADEFLKKDNVSSSKDI